MLLALWSTERRLGYVGARGVDRARARPRSRRRLSPRRSRRRPTRDLRSRRRTRARAARLARRRSRSSHRGARPARGRSRARASRCSRSADPRPRSPHDPPRRPAPRSRSRCATVRCRWSSTVVTLPSPRRERSPRSPTSTVVVVRGCYLTLRRAVRAPALACTTGAVLVEEPGRSLSRREVVDVLGVPVLARVPFRRPDLPGGRRRCAPGSAPRRARARGIGSRRAGRYRTGAPGSGSVTLVPVAPEDPTLRDPARRDSALIQRVHRRLLAEGGDDASLVPDALRHRLTELLRRRGTAARTRSPPTPPRRAHRRGGGPRAARAHSRRSSRHRSHGQRSRPRLRRARRPYRAGRARARRRTHRAARRDASWHRWVCGSIGHHRWSTPAFPTAHACMR